MPDFSQITSHIFIGNAHSIVGNPSTRERDLLDMMEAKVVISALTEEEYEDYMIAKEDFPDIDWHRFIIDDDEDERISEYFFDVHSIINAAISQNKNVVVHCAAGMSRSPTLVIAYLMIENRWGFDEAYNYVKNRRNLTEPNDGFVKQLKSLEFKLKK